MFIERFNYWRLKKKLSQGGWKLSFDGLPAILFWEIHRALSGEIYPAVRFISTEYVRKKNLLIINVILDREVRDEDKEQFATVDFLIPEYNSGINGSGGYNIENREINIYYSDEKNLANKNISGVRIYYRKEDEDLKALL